MLRLILLSVAAAACSGPALALEDLAQELQDARCERLARCGQFPDAASCGAFLHALTDASIAAAVATDKLGYDAERGRRCADAIARQSCDVSSRDAHLGPAACSEMFTGRVPGGDPCSIDVECMSGTCELPVCPERACCVGACRLTQPPAPAGGDCAKDGDCRSGLVCGVDRTCRAPAAADGPCGSERECGDGLACVGAAPDRPGSCRELPGAGELCTDQRCAELGLRCDPSSHTCVPVGLPGDPCPTGIECSINMECDATTHLCREYPTLGMPCNGTCTGDAFCLGDDSGAGTCVPLLENNAPCDGNQQCLSRFCEDGPVFRSCIDAYVCF